MMVASVAKTCWMLAMAADSVPNQMTNAIDR